MCNAFECFLKIATWYWYRWQIPISIRNQFWNMLACNEKGYERHLAPSQPSMPSRRHVHQPKRLPQMSSRRIMSWRVQYGPWMSMSGSFHISGRWGKKTLWSGCCRISFRSEMSSTTAWISMLQTNHFSNLHRFWVQYTFAAWKQSSHFQAFFISTVRTVPVRRRWIVPRVNMIPELPTISQPHWGVKVLSFQSNTCLFLGYMKPSQAKKKSRKKNPSTSSIFLCQKSNACRLVRRFFVRRNWDSKSWRLEICRGLPRALLMIKTWRCEGGGFRSRGKVVPPHREFSAPGVLRLVSSTTG